MKTEKSCGAVIIHWCDSQPEVLLIRHVNGGHWSFPKGHVEKNETETVTALREIKEETGLDVSLDTGFRYVTTYSPKENVTKDVVYFIAVAEKPGITPQLAEVREIAWFSFAEAEKAITYDNDRKILAAARNYLSSE